MKNVTLFSVGLVREREPRRTVRVVLDGRHAGRDALLLAAKIDRAVLLFVPAAAVPYGDLAARVASARALFRLDEGLLGRLLGDLAFVEHRDKTPRCCIRIERFQCHNVNSLPVIRRAPSRARTRGTLRGHQPAGEKAPAAETPGYTTNCPRTRSSSRLPPASRRPFSSLAGDLRRGRGGETCRDKSPCALPPPSP